MGEVDRPERARRSNENRKPSGLEPGKHANTANYGEGGGSVAPRVPGKSSGTEHLLAADVEATAEGGVQGSGGPLPYRERIQASFGNHNIGDVQSFVGGAAEPATRALGARAYARGNQIAFRSAPDLHTVAHEAAHVVQQRQGIKLENGIDGGAGDPHERHADAVADAVVAGQSAEALLGDPQASATVAAPVVQRKTEGEPEAVDVRTWITERAKELKEAVSEKMAGVQFAPESPYATWSAAMPSLPIGQQIANALAFDDASLSRTLYGDDYRSAIVRAATPEPTIESAAGALVAALTTQIAASLRRVMPAYAIAVNQSAFRHEANVLRREMTPADGMPPQPPIAHVLASHPLDVHVRRILCTGAASIDFRKMRGEVPGENKPHDIDVMRVIPAKCITLQESKGKWNWILVSNFEDPRPAEVAKALFGLEEHAAFITPAAPQFGFDPAGGLIEPWKTQYESKVRPYTPTDPNELEAKSASPAGSIPGGKATDATSLQQSATLVGTNVDQDTVRQRLQLIVGVIDECVVMVKSLKMEGDLTGAKKRVEDRVKQLSANSVENQAQLPAWDAESAFQLDTVSKASKALKIAGVQAKSAKGSAGSDAGGNAQAAHTMQLLMAPAIQLGRAWVDVIALSDLPETCKPKIAEAQRRAKLFPVEVGETLLNYVRELIQQTKASSAAGNVMYNTEGSSKKEAELRKKLIELRSVFETDPVRGQQLLGEIQDEIDSLLMEASLGNTIMQLVYLTETLTEHKDSILEGIVNPFTYGKDAESSHRRTNKARIEDTLSYMEIFKERVQNEIGKPFAKGTKEGLVEAKAAFERFSKDDVVKDKLAFAKLVIEDAEFVHAVTAIAAMLMIGIVSGGLGDLVVMEEVGFVASSVEVAGVAVSTATIGAAVVESLTVSTISTLMAKDPTVGHFAMEFFTNFAFGAVFKTVGKNIAAAKKAELIGESEAKALNAASFAGMYTGLTAVRCVELDHAKKAKGQPGITEEEVLETAAHTAAELIGQAIAMHAMHHFGGKLAELHEVRAINKLRTEAKLAADELTAASKKAETSRAEIAKAMEKAIQKSNDELAATQELLRQLDESMNSPAALGKFTPEELGAIRKELFDTTNQLYAQRKTLLVNGRTQVSPDHYEINPGELPDVIAKVKEMGGWHQMEITGKPGEQTIRFEPNNGDGQLRPAEPAPPPYLKFTEVNKGVVKVPEVVSLESWGKTIKTIASGHAPPLGELPQTPVNIQAQRKLEMLMHDAHPETARLRGDFMKQLAASLDEKMPEVDLDKKIVDILSTTMEGDQPKYLRRGPKVGATDVAKLGGLKRAVTFDTIVGNGMVTEAYYQRLITGHASEFPPTLAEVSWGAGHPKKLAVLMQANPPTAADLNMDALIAGRGNSSGWWYAGADEGGASSAAALAKALAASNMENGVIVFELPPDVVTGAREATVGHDAATNQDIKAKIAATKPLAFDGMMVGWSQYNPNNAIAEPTGLTTPEPGSGVAKVREVMVPPVAVKSCNTPVILPK